MSQELPFELTTAAGRPLYGIVQLPASTRPAPAVLICHGFKGFMEWGFFPHLAELLAQRGFVAVRFNFSGSGMAPGDELVSSPDAFRTTTYTLEVEEILRMLDTVAGEELPGLEGRVDAGRMGLLGHSRGGGTAILASASDAWGSRLKALVTWAAVGTFQRFTDEHKALWRRQGYLPIANARTGQELPMGRELLEDLEAHGEALDVRAAAARRQVPWLILHGSDDESVPVHEGESLAEAAAGTHEFHRIEGGSHTFGARHPFQGPTPHLVQALNLTQGWLRRYLA